MSSTALPKWQFKPLSTVSAELGESPMWSADGNCVWWVDISGRQILRTDVASGETRSWPTPEQIGFLALTAGSKLAAGMETGLYAFDPVSGDFDCLVPLTERHIRFNDATTDTAGRLWVGTMDIDNKRRVGTLCRIEPDLALTQIETGFFTPNGLSYDARRRRLYFADSHPEVQTIWVADLDLESGALGPRREFVRMHDFAGRPDGGALDADGNYWIAGVGGGVLHCFGPDGIHLSEVPTPMEAPTKIAFGGPGLKLVFMTSKIGQSGDSGGFLAQAVSRTQGQPEAVFGWGRTL